MTCWTRENVRRTLCDERYTGRLVSHTRAKEDVSAKISKLLPKEEWIIAEDAHEAIISKEMFEQAQRVLKHNRRTKKQAKPYQRFRGLVKCAHCGRTLTRNNGKKPYYYCITRRALTETPCKDVYLEEDKLEESLLQAIRIQIQLAQHGEDEQPDGQTEESILREKLQECQRTVEKCKARQAAAFEDYAEGRIQKQEYLSRKKEISVQQEEAAREYAELSDRLAEAVSERGKETVDLGRYDFVNELTREVLEELVKVVRVGEKDALEIVWNFKE